MSSLQKFHRRTNVGGGHPHLVSLLSVVVAKRLDGG